MTKARPPLPTKGGSYVLNAKGDKWVAVTPDAPQAPPAPEPPAPAPEA